MRERREISVTGYGGSITWHYYTAADVPAYTLTRRTDGRWQVTATIVNGDAFKLAQRPLTFHAPTKLGEWTWEIERYEQQDHTLTARLGAITRRRKERPTDAPVPIRSTRDRAAAYLRGGLDRGQARTDLR